MRGFWYDSTMEGNQNKNEHQGKNKNSKIQEIEDLIASQETVHEKAQVLAEQRPAQVITWAHRRQVVYILTTLLVLAALSAYPIYKFYNKPATCFDEKQNQSETGIDCGGECNLFCSDEVRDIIVNWSESVFVKDGLYDLAASIENPNFRAGSEDIEYVFKIYDEDNALILEKSGTTFIEPREKFVIFEPGVDMGSKTPFKTVFEIGNNSVWTKMESTPSVVRLKNKKLSKVYSASKLSAVLLNDSLDDLFGVEITAVVSNSDGDIIGVSSTYEDVVRKKSSSDIFFTWPSPFTTKPQTGCTAPTDVMLLFDRSGSMGFDGDDPPQPLTSAKKAAASFLESMTPVDQVGLVSFASTASEPIDHGLTSSLDLVKESINSISIHSPVLEQQTNIGDGIEKSMTELLSLRSNAEARKAIVMLTDGVASRPLNPENNTDQLYPGNYAREKALVAKDNEITIYSIGLGDLVNGEFLANSIASDEDHYYQAVTSDDLKKIYSEIAEAVCKREAFVTEMFVRVERDR